MALCLLFVFLWSCGARESVPRALRLLAVPRSGLICVRICLGRLASLAILRQASAITLGTGFRHETSMYGQTVP